MAAAQGAALRKLLLGLLLLAGNARAGEPLQNWFDDPFFQISRAIPHCPLPAGPFTGNADRRVQAHHRTEKGTTCWLAGECEKPNAFMYDHEIAEALRGALRGRFADTTLWVTVQGRVVYFEGCTKRASVVAELEAVAREVPHVQRAIAIVRASARERAPYRVRQRRHK